MLPLAAAQSNYAQSGRAARPHDQYSKARLMVHAEDQTGRETAHQLYLLAHYISVAPAGSLKP
jgi:hypothetical protein